MSLVSVAPELVVTAVLRGAHRVVDRVRLTPRRRRDRPPARQPPAPMRCRRTSWRSLAGSPVDGDGAAGAPETGQREAGGSSAPGPAPAVKF